MGCRPSKTSPTGIQEQGSQDRKQPIVKKRENAKRKILPEEPDVLGHFPDPNKVPKVDDIPKSEVNYMKVEDTFWSKKKKLIPDYSALEKIDNHALQAPDSLRSSPEKLIAYLLKPCKTEVEKLRVLIRWIGNNISYDVAGRDAKNADCTVEGVLRNKRAICEGYANLVHMFCQMSNIEDEKISGQTKNGEHLDKEIRKVAESDHAWNRVKLYGEWFLVDSTWCAGSVGDKAFTRKWDEWWFMTEPKAFVETHLPMARDKSILSDAQMIPEPWQSSEEWDTKVERTPAAYEFGITPLTPTERRIYTKESEILLKFQCQTKLSHFLHVYSKGDRFSEQLSKAWHIIYELDGIVFAHIRFPRSGVYFLKFGAEIKNCDHAIKGFIRGLMYRIEFQGKGAKPYPQASWNALGLHYDFLESGFQLMQPKSPVISTSTGFVTATVKLPTAGVLNNMVGLYEGNIAEKESLLGGLVYGEKKGNIARYYVQCPQIGEYKLAIFAKSEKGNNFHVAIMLLISCTKVNTPIYRHPSDRSITNNLAGPNAHFYELGLTTNQHSSTITFVDDVGILYIKKTHPVVILVGLNTNCNVNTDELLKKDETKDQLKISVNKPNVPGYYWLVIYAKKESEEGWFPYAGCFCLPNKVPFHQNNPN